MIILENKKPAHFVNTAGKLLAALLALLTFILSSFSVSADSLTRPIEGVAAHDLLPSLVIERDRNWSFYVFFKSVRSVDDEWWLCVTTNRIGCELRLWGPDQAEIASTNPAVTSAFHLAEHASITNLLDQIRRAREPRMMPRLQITPDAVTQVYTFALGDLFPIDNKADYTIEIVPKLYKATINPQDLVTNKDLINHVNAELLDFPPIYLKLMTNGAVVSVSGPPRKER